MTSVAVIPEPVSLPGMRQDQYDKQAAFREQLESNLPAIMATLPKGVRAEVMTAVAMTAALDNPKLLDCSPLSMFRSVLKMASLGLRHGETCDLVPIGNKAECWVRVRGVVELAQRSGAIQWAKEGFVVDGDVFEFEERSEGTHFRHVPSGTPKADGSNVTHVYAILTLPSKVRIYEVWTKDRVMEHKAKHAKDTSAGSVWAKHPLPMMAKTVVKAALRFASLSPEMRTAIAAGDEIPEAEMLPLDITNPQHALAAVSGSLEALDRMDGAIITEPATMTLADAEAVTVKGKTLASMSETHLAKVRDWAVTNGNERLTLACDLVIGDRADRQATAEVGE
jgi:recombination protein RecT